MSLLTCVACTTQYALGLDACPHCGSPDHAVDGVAVARRFPSFAHVSCAACGRGPWTVRLGGPHPGLIELPNLFCASCGSQVQVPWPPVEDSMPKNHVGRGPTYARAADPSPDAVVSPPLVGAEADQGHPTPEAQSEAVLEVVAEETPVAEDATDEVGDPYAGLTLAELRATADERGVASYGTKAQITERLRDADTAPSAADDDA